MLEKNLDCLEDTVGRNMYIEGSSAEDIRWNKECHLRELLIPLEKPSTL